LWAKLQITHEQQVAAILGTHPKAAGAGFGEAVAAVKGDGAVVIAVGAEQEPLAAESAGIGDGRIHEGLRGLDAWSVGDRRGGGAEARKEVDALELDIRRVRGNAGEIGRGEHGVANGDVGAGDSEGDAGSRLGEVAGIGLGCVVLGAEGDDVRAGKHPGEGFEDGGGADQRERFGIGERGWAQSDGFDHWLSGYGWRGTACRHGGSRKHNGSASCGESRSLDGMKTGELTEVQRKDAAYARLADNYANDASVPQALRGLADDPRVTLRRGGVPEKAGKCVVYWMQRTQRGRDNHALDKAVEVANALGLACVVYFAGTRNFPHANLRHCTFLSQGLPDVEADCAERGIGFAMQRAPQEDHERFFADVGAAMVIGDEDPMREPERSRVRLAKTLRIPFWTVDADVIVPSKLLEKAQFSAGVARPRLYRSLPEFLHQYVNPHSHIEWKRPRGLLRDDVREDMTQGWEDFDRSVKPVEAWQGGRRAAMKRLQKFCGEMLESYDRDRNRPECDGSSKMSPWLHFGHIGPLTIALAVEAAAKKNPKLIAARDSYFNELIVWRELAVNFVRYQPRYDSPECADNWAKATIAEHDRDQREALYKLPQLENAQTYDELWNAAQLQMVRYGWMHNYLRMYWAKKIVEWTPNAGTAMKVAIYLNDKYELDGRDPNGYAGVAWAVLGKFDRAWGKRPVFGKRRYMSGASTGRKFDSRLYIEQRNALV